VSTSTIFVKSHVSRDLLQNAALFKTDKLVIWEYVSNGLQYVDFGTNPTVSVKLDSKNRRITILDNGRGMDWDGLQNFFLMHGENLDRKVGRPGRGRFGTGKSAAFGIADVLRVTSVSRGTRSAVELSRADLEAASSGSPIPVRTLEKERASYEQNGTCIEIEKIHLRSLDQPGIIRYIERHLAHWPKNCTVFVNNHECEYSEPAIAEERRFRPSDLLREKLGDVELVLKVAKAPVDEDLRGVSIFSNGVWHETTLGGSEGKEMANYLFGEIEVPLLDEDKSPIPPFDLSRSMRLNPSNELVQYIYTFINQSAEQVRRELVEREKKRKQGEEARQLAAQASEIARFINEDFNGFRDRISKVRAKAPGNLDLATSKIGGPDPGPDLLFGSEIPAEVTSSMGHPGAEGNEGNDGVTPPLVNPEVQSSPAGEKRGRYASAREHPRSRGGFNVEFQQMGADERRATYSPDERTIYINLEHPQLVAARGIAGIEEATFRRLAYEVAFTEYAIALSSELAQRGEYLDPSDPIYEIRETVNRLARRGASLYSA
jgi:Histidine kinase-, DNA gyrase B-, and HSP90-like ATPase